MYPHEHDSNLPPGLQSDPGDEQEEEKEVYELDEHDGDVEDETDELHFNTDSLAIFGMFVCACAIKIISLT